MSRPLNRGFKPAALGLALLVLAGCGESSAPVVQVAAGTPVAGGVLKVALDGDPNCVDPHQAGNNTALNVGRQLVDSLTDQDPDSGEIVPWLATRWEVDAESRRFTFHLREGVTFSDGTAVDAQAVKANFEQVLALGARSILGATYLAGLKGIETPDPLTVVVAFDQPNAQFLQATSTMSLGLLANATLASSPADRCQGRLIGSGPFKLERFVHNQTLSLSRRDDYHWASSLATHSGKAWLAGIEFLIVPESGVRLGSLVSGQIDVDTAVVAQNEKTLESQGLPLLARANPGVVFNLTPDLSRAPYTDVRVRQALVKAIDREQLRSIISRYQRPATALLASSTPHYKDLSALLAFDPEGARALLDAAGWQPGADGVRVKDGQRLSLRVDYWQNTPILELVQQQLKGVGVELNLNRTTISQVAALQASGDISLYFYNLTRADPDVLRTLFHVSGRNYGKRQRDALDDRLEASAATLDPVVRQQRVDAISRELIEQGHAIALVELATVIAHGKRVNGLHFEASSRLQFFDTWLEKQ